MPFAPAKIDLLCRR